MEGNFLQNIAVGAAARDFFLVTSILINVTSSFYCAFTVL